MVFTRHYYYKHVRRRAEQRRKARRPPQERVRWVRARPSSGTSFLRLIVHYTFLGTSESYSTTRIPTPLHTRQAKRDAVRGNDDVTQFDLAADIATHDRLRAEHPDKKRIIFSSSADVKTLQEYAVAHSVLGISRRITPGVGLQGYREALLKAMQKHGLGLPKPCAAEPRAG